MTETREEAMIILDDGHRAVRELIGLLPARALTAPGLGGGEWSAKDLIGHLASWEEFALEALEAWGRDERSPIDRDLASIGLNAVNARAVAARSKLSADEVKHDSDVAHATLIDAIRARTEARWEGPATKRSRKSLGHRVGQILGGPAGGFRHAEAHLASLAALVDQQRV
jgi:hypothetical protein